MTATARPPRSRAATRHERRGGPPPRTPRRPGPPRTRGVRWIGWYVREVSGETAYEKYAAHVRRHDPDAEVMTRRQFERSRMDAREADPRDGFRCC
ncbi:YbdD/YjiX family protein [Actinomadura keratinilytica]